MSRTLLLSVVLFALGSHLTAQDRDLVAHWKLNEDATESRSMLETTNTGVTFTAKARDGTTAASSFNGTSAFLKVKSHESLKLGTNDFTLSLWVNTPEQLADDLGDILTMYDPAKRVGFNLSLRTNTGVTSCNPNTRQLQFGIDAGTQPKWTDEGRPGNAILAFSLAVHDGHLYAGTASNAEGEVGRVYRYEAAGKWIDCGAPDKANAISAMAVHDGKLYAASAKYRFAGSSLVESPNKNTGGGIFRYEGEQKWIEVGRLPNTEAIGGMVVYRGKLYASSLYAPAGFFRYESDGKWTSLPTPNEKRVVALGVFNGRLWATSYDSGRLYRYDGDRWLDLYQDDKVTQMYSFATHHGKLHLGAWPTGRVYRWNYELLEDMGRLGNELEVMGMLVHNGQLYAGTLPSAEVYRYDGGPTWTKTGQLDTTPNVKYRRAWTMAQYQGRLFCSTLPSGRIHSMTAGVCVTHDREFPAGWQHLAAVKIGGTLKLYVNGKSVAESASFDRTQFDLSNDSPLLIGAGAGDFFNGSLSDVRIYRRALREAEIGELAKR